MGQSNINLAALIGSRICHDLISPIGAINNGLELLGMADQRQGPELDLISESVESASARIRFFRVAYGAAGTQQMGRAEIVSILQDLTRVGRLEIAYGPLDPHPRSDLRMVFLGVQCLESALPYGGRIEISQSDGQWHLTAHGDKIMRDDTLWNALTGPPPAELAPAHVQFALLPVHARDAHRRIAVEDGLAHRLTLRF